MEKSNSAEKNSVDTECATKRKLENSDIGQDAKRLRTYMKSAYYDTKFDETEYYFEDTLRKVYPYYFVFETFCKGRWVGENLLNVFSQEFRAYSKEQYENSITSGALKVNGKIVPLNYVLKDNDYITNKVHRHEVAVAASPIKIIHLTDDIVVVDKPSSIPVHPCGRYRYNTLLAILQKDYGLKGLHTVHRLDRLTSGLLLFTRTIEKAQEIDEQIRERKVEKEYLCRVEGLFPDGIMECNESIEILSPKMGVSIVSPSGKKCSTTFEKVSYNGKSSVVKCKPVTGRMHQIRVHLQYLGYPIINDPIYNSAAVFGPSKGKNGETGKTRESLLEDLMNTHNLEKWLKKNDEQTESNTENSYENVVCSKILQHTTSTEEFKKLAGKHKKVESKITVEPACDLCQQHYKDPEPKDLLIFLHAYKYKGNDWEFKTEIPVWARDDWTDI